MKNQKILLAAALLALGAASCQKEEKVITQFTAGMEQTSAKTTLGADRYFYWETTDVVKVYSDGDNGSDFAVTPRSDNGTWAVLNGTIAEGDSYTAIYPAGIAASATSVTLPAVQHSADGSLAGFPMYAESGSTEFQFKNLCGALRIHLEQANCTISSIKVTATSPISGTYAVSVTEGTPSLTYSANGANSVTLTLGTVQPIADGHDFYIYLPAGEYINMQLTFYQPDGTICTRGGSVTVERSVCTPVEITNDLAFAFPEGCISGLFSVSATKQVYFSNGNLQYVSGTWRFAEHQYDCLGTYNENAWDLFGWSTAATTYGMSILMSAEYFGDFVDWGTAINPDGGDAPWRTLSSAEWSYLLGTNDQRSGKWGLATITDVTFPGTSTSVTGMVLLPDSWTSCPDGCYFTSSNYFTSSIKFTSSNNFSANQYTAAQWAQMEAAGAVFLPAAGSRYGPGVSVGMSGSYWSSTPGDEHGAYELLFYNYYVSNNSTYRHYGLSVRLVQDY